MGSKERDDGREDRGAGVNRGDKMGNRIADGAVNPLWGGRFSKGADDVMRAINSSVIDDARIAHQDILGSMAHALMLGRCGLISQACSESLRAGLARIKAEMDSGEFPWRHELEDVHMNVETRLAELIGEDARRLHTARSRNDQAATDMRLWLRHAGCETALALLDLIDASTDLASRHVETLMPGFTHLQLAQPVTFGFHLMAHVQSWLRDVARWKDLLKRSNECPLGSAALCGTSYAIDRDYTAGVLGFDAPTENAMDAVSARDHLMEALAACTITAVHQSRLAEELIFWATPLVRFVILPEELTSGSSIMPQKRNPDAAELIRAKPARMLAGFTALVTLMKGLPMAYAKDMQDDKRLTMLAFDDLGLALRAMRGMMGGLTVQHTSMEAAARGHFTTATEIADWLVQRCGVPFREAHHIVGRLVALAESRGLDLSGLSDADLVSIDPRLTPDVRVVLDPVQAISRRSLVGGTAPAVVRQSIALAQSRSRELRGFFVALSARTPTVEDLLTDPSDGFEVRD